MLKVYIDGNELKQSDKNGGVCGEHNSTEMLLSFGEDWTGYNKKVVFYNACGGNPVTVLLMDGVVTSSTAEAVPLPLEGKAYEREEYIIKIPGEALEFEGKAEYVVVGTVVEDADSEETEVVVARKKSVGGTIKVRYSPSGESEEVPEKVAATVGEQLQAEALQIQKKVKEVTNIAEKSAPHVGENGNWYVFDAKTKEYLDSGKPSRGEKGDTGPAPYIGDGGYWYVGDMKTGYKAYLSVSVARSAEGGCVDVAVENPDGTESVAKVYDGVSPRISLSRDDENKCVHIQANNVGEGMQDAYVYDGHSPIITFAQLENGVQIQVENPDGSHNFIDVFDGESGKSPQIIGGNWWTWDDSSGQYVDTGIKAQGENTNDVFIAYYGTTKYDDILNATKANKVVLLYDGNKYLASLNGINHKEDLIFEQHNIADVMEVVEYVCSPEGRWETFTNFMVTTDYLSSNNPAFVSVIQACFPDADKMSFPRENPVSEVSEE